MKAFKKTVHNIIALSGYNKLILHSNGLARALVDQRQDQEALNFLTNWNLSSLNCIAYYWAVQQSVAGCKHVHSYLMAKRKHTCWCNTMYWLPPLQRRTSFLSNVRSTKQQPARAAVAPFFYNVHQLYLLQSPRIDMICLVHLTTDL